MVQSSNELYFDIFFKEIVMTMQKLEREKTLFQLEIDRLSKCLD